MESRWTPKQSTADFPVEHPYTRLTMLQVISMPWRVYRHKQNEGKTRPDYDQLCSIHVLFSGDLHATALAE